MYTMSRYIIKIMYLENPKRLIIWNGGSSSLWYDNEDRQCEVVCVAGLCFWHLQAINLWYWILGSSSTQAQRWLQPCSRGDVSHMWWLATPRKALRMQREPRLLHLTGRWDTTCRPWHFITWEGRLKAKKHWRLALPWKLQGIVELDLYSPEFVIPCPACT